jgi:hypothetical protein
LFSFSNRVVDQSVPYSGSIGLCPTFVDKRVTTLSKYSLVAVWALATTPFVSKVYG